MSVAVAVSKSRLKDRRPYPCEGSCGETLRPWRRSAGEFPGTRMEYSEHRCIGCWHVWKREQDSEDPTYALLPCAAGCGKTTRPPREPLSSSPGTVRRVEGGKCPECTAGHGKIKGDVETISAGLERFLVRMKSDAARVRTRRFR